MTIAEALEHASRQLEDSNVPDARKDASLLISFATGRDRTSIIAHPEAKLSAAEEKLFGEVVLRRALREPIQYITGHQEFYGLEFEVTPDVLIPRPETEILVEHAIGFLSSKTRPRFCEIGTGSGCITVAILSQVPHATAVASDISVAALGVAKRNASKNDVAGRLEFRRSDVFDSIPAGTFDAVVSNPPYVPEPDLQTLQAEVRDFEPTVALKGGYEGLVVVERIARAAPGRLVDGGLLLIEIGFNQSIKVKDMLTNDIWSAIDFLPDLQGIPRILAATKRCKN